MNQATDLVTIPGYRAATWAIDPSRSTITFSIRQLVSRARGNVAAFGGTIVTEARPLASSVTARINLESIDTHNKKRDHHLRSPKYLNLNRYPTATYRSSGLRRSEHGWIIDGSLELHGVIKPVQLALELASFSVDAEDVNRASFVATARLSRKEFGLRMAGAAGGFLVSDTVTIRLEIEAVTTS